MQERSNGYGLLASTTNNVGNLAQLPTGKDLWTIRNEERMVCFVCVLIPRRTINAVGLLDEEFGGVDDQGNEIYGFCDDSYCYRVRQAGLKIGIYDGCFVDHASLPSSFRSNQSRSLEPGQRLFIRKYGVDNHGNERETSPWAHLFPRLKANEVLR